MFSVVNEYSRSVIGGRDCEYSRGYFKVEYTHTSFDEYSDIDSAGDTKVVADTEIDSLRISLGTKF